MSETGTSDIERVPVSPTPTEVWNEDEDDIRSSLVKSIDNLLVNSSSNASQEAVDERNESEDEAGECQWVGVKEPKKQPLVAQVGDTICIDTNHLCTMTYECCLCHSFHQWTAKLDPEEFDPTSVSFKLGSPVTRVAIAPCTVSLEHPNPIQIKLSFHSWQMKGAKTVWADMRSELSAMTTARVDVSDDSREAKVTPESRKRQAEDERTPPRGSRRRTFVSYSTDTIKKKLDELL
jgi:hypothetical protein